MCFTEEMGVMDSGSGSSRVQERPLSDYTQSQSSELHEKAKTRQKAVLCVCLLSLFIFIHFNIFKSI
jgi:hypothetical protein